MKKHIKKLVNRQAAKNRLSKLLSKKKNKSRQARRAITFKLNLTSKLSLDVNLRKFTTGKKNRTKKHSQLVIPLRVHKIREVALTLRANRSRRVRKSRRIIRAPKLLSYITMMVIGLGGMSYFAWQINQPVDLKPVSASSVPAPQETKNQGERGLPRSKPTGLRIPKIDLDVAVTNVGLNDDKTIEVPPLHEPITGWYKLGKSPGEIGPAVIVGHVDTYKGPSVFWRLHELKPGDKITVTRKDGSTVKFKVQKLEQVERNRFPTKKVYGGLDYAGLRLVTCGGTFQHDVGEYTHNTVVFASRIDS